MTPEQMVELKQRIGNALAELDSLAETAAKRGRNPTQHARLTGKMQGLRLALDYLRAYEPGPSPYILARQEGRTGA
jgi:hypothetical protein